MNASKPRVAFLLLLALGITLAFFWVVRDFILPMLMAAIFAAIVFPFYRRLVGLFRGRETLASALTVLLSLVLVIIPLMMF